MEDHRFQFRKGDILAAVSVVVLAVLVFLCFLPAKSRPAAYAEVYHGGKLLRTVPLNTPTEFTVEGKYQNTVTVLDGKIAVTASTCPGEDCVHSGWAKTSGKSIVCLPNELEVRVTAGNDDVDFVVR